MKSDVTDLLDAIGRGDGRAFDDLFPAVYAELHALAGSLLSRERTGHTLQPTALVNEAYLKLVDRRLGRLDHRAQFFAVAARAMRRILVDHARAHARAKRGGMRRVTLDTTLISEEPGVDTIALDEAVERLAAKHADAARVVELRYFVGLTIEETARILGASESTVEARWRYARAWLFRELRKGESSTGVRRVRGT